MSFRDVRGQGYDGAGAMAGAEKGVASRITKKYPLAPYVHCYSHKLNLCVVKVTKVAKIKDMFDHCRCISDFFGNSPKRYEFFSENYDGIHSTGKTTEETYKYLSYTVSL